MTWDAYGAWNAGDTQMRNAPHCDAVWLARRAPIGGNERNQLTMALSMTESSEEPADALASKWTRWPRTRSQSL